MLSITVSQDDIVDYYSDENQQILTFWARTEAVIALKMTEILAVLNGIFTCEAACENKQTKKSNVLLHKSVIKIFFLSAAPCSRPHSWSDHFF